MLLITKISDFSFLLPVFHAWLSPTTPHSPTHHPPPTPPCTAVPLSKIGTDIMLSGKQHYCRPVISRQLLWKRMIHRIAQKSNTKWQIAFNSSLFNVRVRFFVYWWCTKKPTNFWSKWARNAVTYTSLRSRPHAVLLIANYGAPIDS